MSEFQDDKIIAEICRNQGAGIIGDFDRQAIRYLRTSEAKAQERIKESNAKWEKLERDFYLQNQALESQLEAERKLSDELALQLEREIKVVKYAGYNPHFSESALTKYREARKNGA